MGCSRLATIYGSKAKHSRSFMGNMIYTTFRELPSTLVCPYLKGTTVYRSDCGRLRLPLALPSNASKTSSTTHALSTPLFSLYEHNFQGLQFGCPEASRDIASYCIAVAAVVEYRSRLILQGRHPYARPPCVHCCIAELTHHPTAHKNATNSLISVLCLRI